MPRSFEETKLLFDKWAVSYNRDLETPNGILEGYETSLTLTAAINDVNAGSHVLDIGIGTGKFAELYESRGAKISGIDLSEAMLAECHGLHPDYDLQVGTFQHIPYADDVFDAVVSSFCFHKVPPVERLAACKEVHRVIRTGGHVCLLDIMFSSSSAVEEARARLLNHWDDSEDYALVGDLSELLYSSGFHSVQWFQTGSLHFACVGYK